MTKRLVLTQQQPELRTFGFSGKTHIGRYGSALLGQWAVLDRDRPTEFQGLEAAIQVFDAAISRNHALIKKVDDQYVIMDLNSLGGTFLNDTNINPEQRNPEFFPLNPSDRINLAGVLEFVVSLSQSENYALLIAAGEDYEGAAMRDVRKLAEILSDRGYAGQVMLLETENLTKQRVFQELDTIKELSVPDSHVFVYYHGHGCDDGIHVGDQIVNPRQLYKKLGQIRGSKALVIEACNAGIFLNDSNLPKVPPHTLVMAASGVDARAGETRLAGSEYMGRFTNALIEYLDNNHQTINLREFEQVLNGIPNSRLYYQEPRVEGSDFTVLCSFTHVDDRYTPLGSIGDEISH